MYLPINDVVRLDVAIKYLENDCIFWKKNLITDVPAEDHHYLYASVIKGVIFVTNFSEIRTQYVELKR